MKSPTFTIGVDVDGVLLDIHTPWLNLYEQEYGVRLNLEDIRHYGIQEYVDPMHSKHFLSMLSNGCYLYQEASRELGAQLALNTLRRRGHRVLLVTHNRPHGMHDPKLARCLREGFITDPDDFISIKDKSLLRLDALVDDRAETIERATQVGIFGVVYNQPWNEDYDVGDLRMGDWSLTCVDVLENRLRQRAIRHHFMKELHAR